MLVAILLTATGLFLLSVLGWFVVLQVAIRRDTYADSPAFRIWSERPTFGDVAGVDRQAFDTSWAGSAVD